MPDITGLLLAAGTSQRYGSNKLLTDLAGQALIRHSAWALSACDRVIAIVRADDDALQQILQHAGIEWVVNTEAGQGMGRSIAVGVQASGASDGWCILPADMPAIQRATTRTVVAALQTGASMAAPFYRHQRGHPVGFGSVFKDELLALTGDIGARTILAAHPYQLLRLDVDDAGILHDIDTPEDRSKSV
jgi:molybdenum cofactor cytidylyltransferase